MDGETSEKGVVNNASRLVNEVNRHLQKNVGVSTVKLILHAEGLVSDKRQKKPFLNSTQKQTCRKWALAHKDCTVEEWKKVVWSDEIKINCYGSDGPK